MDAHSDIVAQLSRGDFAVVTDFLARSSVAALLAEQCALYARGLARAATIGHGASQQLRSEIRGDEILWLDPAQLSPAQSVYWQAIERLRVYLNENLFLSLAAFEAHFARYPAGRGYARHVDVFHDDSRRMLSCSLYLNEGWEAADSGALRLYAQADSAIDILPLSATLVIFKSQVVAHEVLPARRPRHSLTGWFKCRAAME